MKTLAARKSLLAWTILAVLAAVSVASGEAPSPAGRWSGAIELPGQSLAVDVQLTSSAGSAWSGSIDIPAQGARALALTGFRVEGSAVRFSISGIPGNPTFDGTLSSDGGSIAGDFTQGGQTFPFRLALTEVSTPSRQPRIAEIVLTKKPPARLSDPAFLKTLAGDYVFVDIPSVTLTVAFEASALVARVGGQELYRLEPYRETEFQFRDRPGYGIRFVVDAKGAVDEILFLDPDAVYRARRKK
jgi:hypothetical protein